MKTILPLLFVFAFGIPSLPAASFRHSGKELPAQEMRRAKIYQTWATNRYTGQRICVYTGPSKWVAQVKEEIWDRRPGWKAKVTSRRY